MRRLLAWAERNNEEIGDVGRCRSYFDLAKPGIKAPPRRWEYIAAPVIVGVFTASFALAGFFAIQPRAMVNAKQPNASVLLLSSDDIQVWRTAKHFDAADCATERPDVLATRVGIPSAEIAVACGWFEEKDLTLQIARTLRQ
jgi:hypothetical protein